MKTRFIGLIVLGITLMSTSMLYAQEYICLKEDMCVSSASADTTVQLFKYSTIKVSPTLKCRIENMTPEAEAREKTGGSGLKKQAIFEVILYSDTLAKLRFKDNKGNMRYDVKGVTSIKCYYSTLIYGKEYLVPYDKSLIKATVKKHSEDYPKLLFTYDTVQNALFYTPNSDRFRMPSGAKLVLDDSRQVGLNFATTIPKVEKNVRLRLITSSDTSCFEDLLFTTDSVKQVGVPETIPTDDWFNEWLKHYWIWVVIIVVIAGLIAALVYCLIRIKKDSYDSLSNTDEKYKKQISNLKEQISNLTTIFNNLGQNLDVLKTMPQKLEEITKALNQETTINELEEQLKQQQRANQGLEEQLKEKKNDINTLQKDNDDLNDKIKKLTPDKKTTIAIPGSRDFAKQAKSILDACLKGEEIVQNYLKSLPYKDKEKFAYFTATYIENMPFNDRDKWNGILSSLSINEWFLTTGYKTDFTKMPDEEEKINWLKEHFINDLLIKYLSPLIIMLEEIRCAKEYGVETPAPKEVTDAIKKIIVTNKALEVNVSYFPLFKRDTSQENVELTPAFPVHLQWLEPIVCDYKEVPFFFERIGFTTNLIQNNKTQYVQYI